MNPVKPKCSLCELEFEQKSQTEGMFICSKCEKEIKNAIWIKGDFPPLKKKFKIKQTTILLELKKLGL